ncbi:hypothetical protein PF011_g23707 [Phytophthora fragariae]|uniref:Uncharacterized protein n=1 Tax=Phytophthora fragariae TaxID=53985 RepID=A0A6A3I8Z4_9STRA|nr:hypothetical protein PF011_g23707 [Phytophthora fragariae]
MDTSTIVGPEELPMDLVERVQLVMGSEVQRPHGRQVERTLQHQQKWW